MCVCYAAVTVSKCSLLIFIISHWRRGNDRAISTFGKTVIDTPNTVGLYELRRNGYFRGHVFSTNPGRAVSNQRLGSPAEFKPTSVSTIGSNSGYTCGRLLRKAERVATITAAKPVHLATATALPSRKTLSSSAMYRQQMDGQK